MSLKSLSITIIEAFASAKCFRDQGRNTRGRKSQSWVGPKNGGRGGGCLAPGKSPKTTLTFEPWKLLFFFGSEKVGVRCEVLGSVGSFRCWVNREVEPSCITITSQRNGSKPQGSDSCILYSFTSNKRFYDSNLKRNGSKGYALGDRKLQEEEF